MRYERTQAKVWARESLRGHMIAITTPFLADGEIDEAGLRANVEHFIGLPCVGSIYAGSLYQEPFSMTLEERKRVDRIVIDATGGRVPVMVSASSNCVADSVELARHAEAAGADLAMLWPPHYGNRTRDGVLAFLRAVARQTDIGLCMYSTTLADLGFYVDAGMLEALAGEPNICAVKEASMSPSTYLDTLRRVGDVLTVSCPVEEYWLLGRQMAGERYAAPVLLGTSRPLYLETKSRPYLSDFFDAVDRGDHGAAGSRLSDILVVANALHNRYIARGEHNVAITKAVTGLLGLAAGSVRPPLSWPADAAVAEAREVLAGAGLLPAT